MITFIKIIPLKVGKINLTFVIMKVDDEMSIEISSDYYHNDYDDISEKQTNELVDDSNDEAAEMFGY